MLIENMSHYTDKDHFGIFLLIEHDFVHSLHSFCNDSWFCVKLIVISFYLSELCFMSICSVHLAFMSMEC